MVLDQLKAMNIEVLLNSRLQSILTCQEDGATVFKGLVLEDNSSHVFDMVIFAIGITPCDELAKASGIDTHVNGGIVIQPDLRTSVDDVYAIGECASFQGRTYGFIAPGVEMADVLAYNLARGPADKSRNMTVPDTSTRLKLAGVNAACGENERCAAPGIQAVFDPQPVATGHFWPRFAVTFAGLSLLLTLASMRLVVPAGLGFRLPRRRLRVAPETDL